MDVTTASPHHDGGIGGHDAALTAGGLVASAARLHKGAVAYIFEGEETCFGDHILEADRFAALLQAEYGISQGDCVAVLAATSRAHIALWHAALLGYFTLVPLNFRLTVGELHSVLQNASPSLVIYDDDLAVLATGATQFASQTTPLLAMRALQERAMTVQPLARPLPRPEDIAIILYTSGTTGLPKGVEFSQRALALTNARQHEFWDICSPGTCLYTTTPLFHVSAIFAVLGPVLEGNRVVLVPQFDVDRLIEDSARYKLTHMALVSVMIARFLHHERFQSQAHRHIRYIIYGGSPVPLPIINELAEKLPDTDLIQSYGMTEAIGASTLLSGADHRAGGKHLKSCGKALPGVAIQICNADGKLAPQGESGEIELKSDAMLSGYRHNAEATKAALADGWFRTGDVGYLDDEGYLYVVDRLKDMIITGGENVYSQEVEHCIGLLPGVSQVAVIGIPSEAWGEQVHAVIVPQNGVALDPAALKAAIKLEIASYKCPKSFEFLAALPLTGTNKVNKRALRDSYLSAAGKPQQTNEIDKI